MKKKKYNKVNKKLKYCYPEKAVYLFTCSAQTLPSKCLEDTHYYFVIQQLLELHCLFLIDAVTRSCSTKTLKTLPKCTVSILTSRLRIYYVNDYVVHTLYLRKIVGWAVSFNCEFCKIFQDIFFYSTPVNGCLCFKCDTLLIGSKYFSVFFLRTHILSGF